MMTFKEWRDAVKAGNLDEVTARHREAAKSGQIKQKRPIQLKDEVANTANDNLPSSKSQDERLKVLIREMLLTVLERDARKPSKAAQGNFPISIE